VHAPPHPAKTEPAPGVAVKVTEVPVAKLAVQTVLQVSPAGALVTVPVPAPETVTLSPTGTVDAKVAVTVVARVGVTVQPPVPEHPPPDQPANVEPPAAVAGSTTPRPAGKLAEQVVPHAMPAGELVTLPLPSPARTTVTDTGAGANAAPTVVAAASVSVHAPVPEHPPPDHPVNTEPAAAVAESVTLVPAVNVAEHVAPQGIPAGGRLRGAVPLRVPARGAGRAAAGGR